MASNLNNTSAEERASSNTGDVTGEEVEMVLWTRRPVCGPRTSVIDRLSTLSADDEIDEFRVETWPDELAVADYAEHDRVVERYKEFLLWAEEHDRSITPPFERRTISPLIGDSREVLTLPVMCLAVYEGDSLRGVYPNSDGDRSMAVSDFLDVWETRDTASIPGPGDS